MLFQFSSHSGLLLPFVLWGLVLAGHLLVKAWRFGTLPDGLLALLLLLNVLPVAQWMLGYAGWYDSHDGYSTTMFYVPWQPWLLWGPAFYLYFRSLTNQEFTLRKHWRHLLPGLVLVGLYAGAAGYDLVWSRALHGQALPYHYGTKGEAANLLDYLSGPANWLGYALMLGYGLATLRLFRRYRRYLDDNFSDTARLRFRGLRDLLVAALLGLVLWLSFDVVNRAIGPLGYGDYWYAYFANGALIYFLSIVGLQANFAAITPLRFEPEAEEAPPLAGASGAGATAVAAPAPAQALTAELAATLVPASAEAAVAKAPFEVPTTPPGESPEAPAPVAKVAAPAATLAPELHPWRDKLLALMADDQPWLEPELTLAELAYRLRTNTSLLSHVINTGCGQNFNDFVNSYRVAEAERKLQDPRLAHYSLVGIALESGFNSKSTFNRVFKKLTGRTPGEVARPKS
ncbi:helix-turn-helix transcriptional regulator [Hymenobacter sp. 5317J-9]|uniref:helix-turn-helix domain-containing protein n=1 Tax=Hymenobacter sp. 5317J-9 TaxID=2932250 RepID=UPI001FD6CB01|nr:helix-turn-helix transcriptional regulator [Hymenobacter sp. 5317J-9]UOQ96146.1 helix-turn-helix transcriptional regulator [Hymenobacter sp. 5317J-9]